MTLPDIAPPLLRWYEQNKRTLPFRTVSTPYRVWVSEIDLARRTQKAEGPHAPVPASPQRDAAEGGQARRSPAPDAGAACAQSAQELLQAAARAAVQMLVRTVDDENATLPQRMDAAKTILDRVYGKASQPIEGNGGAAVQVVMSKEVRELMG